MSYAAAAQKKKPNFYVAKSWHNRFAGTNGENIRNACKRFKVQIKLPRRESSDTGVYVTGDENSIEKTRKYFEKILGFIISIKPLMVGKCKIVPIEVDLLTNDINKYLSMVKKYGVAVAFPKKNNNDSLTLIQGRDIDINGVIIEFGKILKRKIILIKDLEDTDKHNDEHKEVKVINRRLRQSMCILNMELNEVLFFHPADFEDDHNFERFIEVLNYAEHSIDVCVFTTTDDRIRYTLANEAKNGIKIRVITDNSQVEANGSDARWLKGKGIPVKVHLDPNEQCYMHHKFCIIDSKIAMTGSFNWTRSASDRNYENILITTNKSVVEQYENYFKNMWKNDKTIVPLH